MTRATKEADKYEDDPTGSKSDADKPDEATDQTEARAFAEATGVYADPLLAIGYRALDDEFEEGTFDLEGAVTAIAVRIEDEGMSPPWRPEKWCRS
ncbi:hypothetical protein [Streptomyces sp. DG1A-41]|uniref:hypothetical protein n=1 Tax=Streptomyces sp. DG1A-41 TaxID=3125779 RepID=UPI0030D11E1E